MTTKYIIYLDGAKGVGKSTVCALLKKKLTETIFLDWGCVWREVYDKKPKDEDDILVLETAIRKVKSILESGVGVLLDNHLTNKRMQAFDFLAKECGVVVLKYHMTAPIEILLERVRARDLENGTLTNIERFYSMHKIQQDKDFSGFKVLDTTVLSPNDIANIIIKDVTKLIENKISNLSTSQICS